MKNWLTPFVVFLLASGLCGAVYAEKADRDKPMQIDADFMRHDELKQTSVFTGKVVLTKGTILMRGSRLEIRQDPAGYQYATVTAESGNRAFYRQKQEAPNEFIEAESEVIEYDGRLNTVKFKKNAQMRRYFGSKLNDELTGDLIVYDNTSEVFTVNTASSVTPSAGNAAVALPSNRVRMVLTPQPKVPTVEEAAPPPVLRPQITLEQESR